MVELDQQSAPKQLTDEVPSHVVLVNNEVGAFTLVDHRTGFFLTKVKFRLSFYQ